MKPYRPHPDRDDRLASAIRAAEALVNLDLYPAHKRELLSICVWKVTEIDGKQNLRFVSRGAVEASVGESLEHEHVFPRKGMVDEMMGGKPVAEVLKDAVACLVTKSEHEQLTRETRGNPDLVGWARYEKAGIEVIDRLSQTES